jgi:hypothetical protein
LLELALSDGAPTPRYILRMSQRDAGLLRTVGTRALAANIISVSCQVCWRRKRWHHGLTVVLENLLSVRVFEDRELK